MPIHNGSDKKQAHAPSIVSLPNSFQYIFDTVYSHQDPATWHLYFLGNGCRFESYVYEPHCCRRFTWLPAFDANTDTSPSANFSAYDFVASDTSGKLYRSDPADKRAWFTYGAAIVAPAEGIVVATANDIPENTFGSDGSAVIPPAAAIRDPKYLGNHVILKHRDGRVSWFLHICSLALLPSSLATM